MKFLIMGEFSGRVRDIMRGGGLDATSCDFRPTETPGPHYQGDVRDILYDGWGGMIAFPNCERLCGSGLHWNNRGRGWEGTEEALKFVALLLNSGISYIGLENPIGCISTRIRLEDGKYEVMPVGVKNPKRLRIPVQVVQPYDFGDDASKATCIFSKGLPEWVKDPALRVPGRWVIDPRNGKLVERWSNQTDSGQNRLGPSDTRAKDRAVTYPGIAKNGFGQWVKFFKGIMDGN